MGLRQLEVRLRVQQIYVGFPIRVDGASLSPVGRCAAYPLNEGKCRNPVPPEHARQNRTAQVVGGLPLGILPQYLPQDREAKQINPIEASKAGASGGLGLPFLCPPPARLSQDSNILSRNLTDSAGRLHYIADERMDDIRTRFAVHVMLRYAA